MIIPVGRLQENAEDDEDDVQLVEEPVEMEEDEKGTGHLKAGSVVVLSAGLYLLSQYLLRQSELQSAILIELVRFPNQSWRPERGERKTSRQMVSLWTWMRSHCEDWMRWVLTWLIIMVKHSPKIRCLTPTQVQAEGLQYGANPCKAHRGGGPTLFRFILHLNDGSAHYI